jgi:hypothetical protein
VERQEADVQRIGRELNIVCGGIAQGALDEAWKRSKDPVGLCGTVAKDALIGAGTSAVCMIAPEIVLPVVVISTAAVILENPNVLKQTWDRNGRIGAACRTAWNDPTKEILAKDMVAKAFGKPFFDNALGGVCGGLGMVAGVRFAEGKLAQVAEEAIASKRLVMSDLGNGTLQTRIGNSLVTTRADGTVIKQFDSGLIERHIPMSSGKYMVTERSPNGTLTTILPEGTRLVESPTGRVYSFEPDGSYDVMKQTGLKMSVATNGERTFVHPSGVATKYSASGKERFLSAE